MNRRSFLKAALLSTLMVVESSANNSFIPELD
jgi:hypothetical protein